MSYTVKAVASMAGVSVRTLHYYDEIGLVRPDSLSPAGYRLYSRADLERLQQVLFFKELGFGLREIKTMVESPAFDRKQALAMHRRLLLERRERLETLISSVEQTLDAIERGMTLDTSEMFEGFDEVKLKEYQEEARQRWGHTDAYKESMRRTARYTRADWTAIKFEEDAINGAMAGLMGGDPESPEVQEWMGRKFRLIDERFYPCSAAMFRGLGDMYVEDPRFAETYDKVRPGLARFMRAAMHAYADALEGKG